MDVIGGRWDGADKGMYSDELLSKAKEIESYGTNSHHSSRVVANLRRIAQYTYIMALGLYVHSFGPDEDRSKAICRRCWHPLQASSVICPGCGHPVITRKPQKPADDGFTGE